MLLFLAAVLIWNAKIQEQIESTPLTSADIVGTWTDDGQQNGNATFYEDGTFIITDIPVNLAENKRESFSAQGTWHLSKVGSYRRMIELSYTGQRSQGFWLNTSGAGDSLRLNFFLIDKAGQYAFKKTG